MYLRSAFAIVSLVCLINSTGMLWGQLNEVEPNNSCVGAHVLGAAALPLSINGRLDGGGASDIDFFTLEATPGEFIQIDLLSVQSESGLPDPFLGVFDSNCFYLALDDDGGDSLNSRLRLIVPADGLLTLAATACCDYAFEGSFSTGDYILNVAPVEVAGPITGRLLDADSGNPLSGDFPQYAYAVLYRCDFNSCFEWINTSIPDSTGLIEFSQNYAGDPLVRDTYKIYAGASGFQTFESEIFELTAAGLELGDIEISPLRFIGSISGRLVDALDGRPLTTDSPDFASFQLRYCFSPGFCNPIAEGIPDSQGRFIIDGRSNFLLEGEYVGAGFSAQAIPTETPTVSIARDEHIDLGDIALAPLPIQLSLQTGCQNIPASGGACNFTLRARNGTAKKMSGAVWANLVGYGTSSQYSHTQFQVGKVGTTNPQPQRFNLKSGQDALFDFSFDVPAWVREGSNLCMIGFAGADPQPQLNVLADQGFLFCIIKEYSGFQVLTGKAARDRLKANSR